MVQGTTLEARYPWLRKHRLLWRKKNHYWGGIKPSKWQNYISQSVYFRSSIEIRFSRPKTTLSDGLAGMSAVGRTPLKFVPSGVKINSSTYCELILEPVVKNLSRNMFNGESFIFQQDGAPAHTSNASQTWLRKNIPRFIAKDECPPIAQTWT